METSKVQQSVSQQNSCSIPKYCDVQPQYVYESTIHPQNLLNTLNEQRQFGLLCDITVIVEGVQLLAHKAVLAACSSYFNGIITDPANVSHNIVLELSSVTKVGMENLLEFAYTSKLTVSKDNIDHVLCAARELEVKNLEYSCLNLLKQKLLQDTTGGYAVPSCFESKNVCRNSTISRQLVPSKPENQSFEKTSTETTLSSLSSSTICPIDRQLLAGGGYPLMSQLSLNPTAQPSVPHSSACVVDKTSVCTENLNQTQTVLKQLKSFGATEKNDKQSFLPRILPQPQPPPCNQGLVPVVKMVTASSSTSETKKKFACSTYPSTLPISCPEAQSKNKYVFSSSCNSDTDETLSADDDVERSYKCPLSSVDSMMCKGRKYPDVVLPLSVEEITKLPRSELQDLLNKHPNLSVQQINAMHEIRRRGKNRIAAQRCRKRKMDCIRSLQCKLETLHKEHNELMNERRSVRENASKLSNLFQLRCLQVFSDSVQSCKKAMLDGEDTKGGDGPEKEEDVFDSMAKYFQQEAVQAKNLVDRLSKFPCKNLPPFNWPCPVASPAIVVVCDEEEQCCKPCSPSLWSNASFSSDITDGSNVDSSIMQDVQCTVVPITQQSTTHKEECSGINVEMSCTSLDEEQEVADVEEEMTSEFITKTTVT